MDIYIVRWIVAFLIYLELTIGIPVYLGQKLGSWVVKKYFRSWGQISVTFIVPLDLPWRVLIVAIIIFTIVYISGILPAGTDFLHYIYRALMGQPQVPVFVVGYMNISILSLFVVSFADFLLESYLQSNKDFGQV